MSMKRMIRRAILAWQGWRFKTRVPAIREADRAEHEAARRNYTQGVHRARQTKRMIILDELRRAGL